MDRIADVFPVTFHCRGDRPGFQRDTGRVETCSRTCPVRCRAAEQRTGQCRGRRRVADPHLADDQGVKIAADRVEARRERGRAFGLGHRRGDREIRGRRIEIERRYPEFRTLHRGKLIDGGTARCEIRDHLDRDFRRESGHALGGNAVIAGKNQNLHVVERGGMTALPGGAPRRELFEPAERPCRLGEVAFARRGCILSISVGRRQIFELFCDIGVVQNLLLYSHQR